MKNFKEMTQVVVNEVVASMAIEELNTHTLENRFAILDNVEQAVNVLAMNSYDLNRNRRDKVNPKELWNSSLSHSLYSAEWNKLLEGHVERKAPARACIKANVKHGSSYITSERTASTTKYDNNKIYDSEGKEIKATTSSVYHIVSYRVYRQAVILDIESTETSKVYRSYDEYLENVTPNDIDHSRDEENDNAPFIHLVFRYQPLTKTGKPNPYCGLEQLKTWLHTLKIVNDNAPATLKDALELIVNETVEIPFAPAYSYTSKADYLTVYTYAGDTEDLEDEFKGKETVNYQCISDFELKTVFSDDESYNESFDNVQCGLGNTDFYPIIIKYDCHKEFRTQLPLAYSHIGYIFD